MLVDALVVEKSPLLQVRGDLIVGVLYKLAREGVAAKDHALVVHRLDESQGALPAHAQVFVTEGRGDVDYARPIFHGDEVHIVNLPGLVECAGSLDGALGVFRWVR